MRYVRVPRTTEETMITRRFAVLVGVLPLTLLCACGADETPAEGTSSSDVAAANTDASPGCRSEADCPAATKTCHIAVCLSSGLCDQQPRDGTPCDDGKACTVGDRCVKGACKGEVDVCECQQTADCSAHEDGNKCNGTLYCRTDSVPYRCALDPSSVVDCSGHKPTACRFIVCDPNDG